MSYRFKLGEDIRTGVRRIVADQIGRAQGELTEPDDFARGIHEARKSIKRIRSLLRIVRPGLVHATFEEENARFRDIADGVSAARDAHVTSETLASIEQSDHIVSRPSVRAARRVLKSTGTPVIADLERRCEIAVSGLQAARSKIDDYEIEPAEFEIVFTGLARSYKTARHAFRRAYQSQCDEDFHDWRKAVQHHWRHMTLLQNGWPNYFDARAAEAKQLAHLIGDDHDLAVLATRLEAGNDAAVRPIVDLCRQRQRSLRAAAKLHGQRLFDEGSRRFTRRIRHYWQLAETMSRDDEADRRETGTHSVQRAA